MEGLPRPTATSGDQAKTPGVRFTYGPVKQISKHLTGHRFSTSQGLHSHTARPPPRSTSFPTGLKPLDRPRDPDLRIKKQLGASHPHTLAAHRGWLIALSEEGELGSALYHFGRELGHAPLPGGVGWCVSGSFIVSSKGWDQR